MKTTLALALTFALAAAGSAFAGMEHKHGAAPPSSAAFDALKKLEGTWTGKASMEGAETFDTTVTYKVIGTGSTVEERIFADTPHEMVTMYHMDGDNLVLTHYCVDGNQPRMKLASSDGKTLSFTFAGGTNIKKDGTHMHDAKITLIDADRMKAEWTSWSDGKFDNTAVFDLTRKK